MHLLKGLVTERREKIKQLVDSHAELLQEEIQSRKERMFGYIKLQKEKLEKLQASVIGYREEISERKEFTTIEAVIQTMTSIKVKAEALTEQCEALFDWPTPNQERVALKESDFGSFLGESNVIGQIEGTKVISTFCCLSVLWK